MQLSNEDILSNSVVEETYSKGVNLVIAKEVVFRCYIHRLNTAVAGQKITDFDSKNYKVWLFKKIPDLKNSINTCWNDIKDYMIKAGADTDYIGTLNNTKIISISSDTGLESDVSLQQVLDVPASGYIFSIFSTSAENYITSDWNFDRYTIDPLATIKYHGKEAYENTYDKMIGVSGGELFNRDYWNTNYSFSGGYDSSEYKMYNLARNILPEDEGAFTSNDLRLKIRKIGKKFDAIVITYTYPYAGNNEVLINIPVTYNEIHKASGLIDGYINIEWSSDGIITVK